MLKYRLPPLLLLLVSKHPRGEDVDEVVDAVVSDHPTCPAAASHVAVSSIRTYPLSAHVPEVTMGYTVIVCAQHTSTAEASTPAKSISASGRALAPVFLLRGVRHSAGGN